jgi:hypothetical protein
MVISGFLEPSEVTSCCSRYGRTPRTDALIAQNTASVNSAQHEPVNRLPIALGARRSVSAWRRSAPGDLIAVEEIGWREDEHLAHHVWLLLVAAHEADHHLRLTLGVLTA